MLAHSLLSCEIGWNSVYSDWFWLGQWKQDSRGLGWYLTTCIVGLQQLVDENAYRMQASTHFLYSLLASNMRTWYPMRSGMRCGCFFPSTDTYTAKACNHSQMFVQVCCFSFDLADSSKPSRVGTRSPISIKRPDSILSTTFEGTGGIAAPGSIPRDSPGRGATELFAGTTRLFSGTSRLSAGRRGIPSKFLGSKFTLVRSGEGGV